MTNYEKYKDKIENHVKNHNSSVNCFIAFLRNETQKCTISDCNNCILKNLDFLFSEYKEPIKLTLHEKCILESLDKEYEWIVRGKNDMLYLFENKPSKGNIGFWYCSKESNGKDLYFFDHLFKFIKWEDEEPRNIQELIENCEAIEDD